MNRFCFCSSKSRSAPASTKLPIESNELSAEVHLLWKHPLGKNFKGKKNHNFQIYVLETISTEVFWRLSVKCENCNLVFFFWIHTTESTERQIRFRCICWQHAAPNTYIKNLTSHLLAMIRTHNFNFGIRFWPISALMLKNYHQIFFDIWNFQWHASMASFL